MPSHIHEGAAAVKGSPTATRRAEGVA